jgi:hypothetical protein
VTVVGIDNGFGAAHAVLRLLNRANGAPPAPPRPMPAPAVFRAEP